MAKIDTNSWKPFVVGELFDIHPTKAYKMTNAQLMDDGDNPVVVNSSYTNGIGGYSMRGFIYSIQSSFVILTPCDAIKLSSASLNSSADEYRHFLSRSRALSMMASSAGGNVGHTLCGSSKSAIRAHCMHASIDSAG